LKILIIIPAFNEEKNIVNLIEEIIKIDMTLDIIVINDASEDNTSYKAKKTGTNVIIFRLTLE